MKRVLIAVLAIGVFSGPTTTAQSSRQTIQGVWRIVEATVSGPAARTIAFGDRPNLTIITSSHYSRVEIQADKPRAALPDVSKATADELRAVWGPVVAEAGTYELSGNEIKMQPVASKNPAVMGSGVFITYEYKLEGRNLTLTQMRNQNGPFTNPFSLKLVRVE